MLDTRAVFAKIDSEWTVPSDLPYLNGHFPGQPVFPAVGIVDASVELVRKLSGVSSLYLKSVPSAKFSQPIGPGSRVHIDAAKVSADATASGSGPSGEWQIDWSESGAPEKKIASLRLEFAE